MKKLVPFIVIAVLLVVTILLNRGKEDSISEPTTSGASKSNVSKGSGAINTSPKSTAQAAVNRNRGFDRRTNYLEYTAHARCGMQCRKITQKEVEEIMKAGTINYKKSDVKQKPCPTYALEGTTSDNQRVRIVFAQCDHTTKVVTVIDLNTDHECDCPGDKKK